MAMVLVVQVCPHQVSGSKHPVPQCTAMDLPLATAPTPATSVKHQGDRARPVYATMMTARFPHVP